MIITGGSLKLASHFVIIIYDISITAKISVRSYKCENGRVIKFVFSNSSKNLSTSGQNWKCPIQILNTIANFKRYKSDQREIVLCLHRSIFNLKGGVN